MPPSPPIRFHLHLFHAASSHAASFLHRPAAFWLVWTLLTAAAILWVFTTFPPQDAPPIPAQPSPRRSIRSIPALLLLTAFLAAYSIVIFAAEDFNAEDEAQLSSFSVRGIDLQLMIWPSIGRFYPLSMQEFNLLRHITTTPNGYHLMPMAEVLAMAGLLLILQPALPVSKRAILVAVALLTPSVVVSSMGLVLAERHLELLLLGLLAAVYLFQQAHSRWWAVAAVLCCQLLLYLKEPVFLWLLAFAAVRLVLRCKASTRPLNQLRHLNDPDSRLDFLIIALSLVFLSIYSVAMIPHTSSTRYLVEEQKSLSTTISLYLHQDALAWLLTGFVALRGYRLFKRQAAPNLLWDPIALGAVLYFGAYLAMRMAREYYLAPVDFIAVIYLGNWLFAAWPNMKWPPRILTATCVTLLLFINLSLSAFRIAQRKYSNYQRIQIANAILHQVQQHPQSVHSLYFPGSYPFQLGEFLQYLRYRGLQLQQVDVPSTSATLQVAAAATSGNGKCWAYADLACSQQPSPPPASLIIVLPRNPPAPQDPPNASQTTVIFSNDLHANLPPFINQALVNAFRAGYIHGDELATQAYIGLHQ